MEGGRVGCAQGASDEGSRASRAAEATGDHAEAAAARRGLLLWRRRLLVGAFGAAATAAASCAFARGVLQPAAGGVRRDRAQTRTRRQACGGVLGVAPAAARKGRAWRRQVGQGRRLVVALTAAGPLWGVGRRLAVRCRSVGCCKRRCRFYMAQGRRCASGQPPTE